MMSLDTIQLIRELLENKLRTDKNLLISCIENDGKEQFDDYLRNYRLTMEAITDFEDLLKEMRVK